MLPSEKQSTMPFAEPSRIAVRKIGSAAVFLMANYGLKFFRGQPKQGLKLCYAVRRGFLCAGLMPGRGKRPEKEDKSSTKLNDIPPTGSGTQGMSRAASTPRSG
jgi:hypothetical protein